MRLLVYCRDFGARRVVSVFADGPRSSTKDRRHPAASPSWPLDAVAAFEGFSARHLAHSDWYGNARITTTALQNECLLNRFPFARNLGLVNCST